MLPILVGSEDPQFVLVAFVVDFHAPGPCDLRPHHVLEDVSGPRDSVEEYGDLFSEAMLEASCRTCRPCHWRKLYPPIAPQYHVATKLEIQLDFLRPYEKDVLAVPS